jgi:hypothetical protein
MLNDQDFCTMFGHAFGQSCAAQAAAGNDNIVGSRHLFPPEDLLTLWVSAGIKQALN